MGTTVVENHGDHTSLCRGGCTLELDTLEGRSAKARRRRLTSEKVTFALAALLLIGVSAGIWVLAKNQQQQANEFEKENWPTLYNSWHVRMWGTTPTADECQVADVREFQDALGYLLTRIKSTRNDFEILMTQGRHDPSIMSQVWSEKVSKVSQEMTTLDDELEKMELPLLMRPMHENLVLSGLHMNAAWFAVRVWVESDRSDQT